jgi:hypothetical protein
VKKEDIIKKWNKVSHLEIDEGWQFFISEVREEFNRRNSLMDSTVDTLEHNKGYVLGLEFTLRYLDRIKKYINKEKTND